MGESLVCISKMEGEETDTEILDLVGIQTQTVGIHFNQANTAYLVGMETNTSNAIVTSVNTSSYLCPC